MAQNSKKATINDVAREAGVSKKTVSRVINKSPEVTKKTYQKVEQAIARLNYTPDPQARGLSFRRSFLFGLIYDNVNAAFIADIQDGVLDKSRAEGYELVVHPCKQDTGQWIDEVRRLIDRLKLAGVIVLPPLSESPDLVEMLKGIDCEYVRILSVPLDDDAHMVQSDDRSAVAQIADHLFELGHRNIGFIHGPKDSQAAAERYAGFSAALQRNKLKLLQRNLVWGDHSFASGVVGAQKLLAGKSRPTAIVASNDEMALGAMVAAAKLGIDVPSQLSIVGFDDEPQAAKIYPSLTTVNHNLKRMGQLASEKLAALCRNEPEQAALIRSVISLDLIVRESTATAPP
ncbi:MAG: LacI family DNA-binding transcriptional regulator [Gammaproteobacteria bacterium]|nr:LacI family DNA-binding transcriptional regulator [Gammaproteobacteria bacterium]